MSFSQQKVFFVAFAVAVALAGLVMGLSNFPEYERLCVRPARDSIATYDQTIFEVVDRFAKEVRNTRDRLKVRDVEQAIDDIKALLSALNDVSGGIDIVRSIRITNDLINKFALLIDIFDDPGLGISTKLAYEDFLVSATHETADLNNDIALNCVTEDVQLPRCFEDTQKVISSFSVSFAGTLREFGRVVGKESVRNFAGKEQVQLEIDRIQDRVDHLTSYTGDVDASYAIRVTNELPDRFAGLYEYFTDLDSGSRALKAFSKFLVVANEKVGDLNNDIVRACVRDGSFD